MKTGIELIAKERHEQLNKHGRSVELDVELNNGGQLRHATRRLLEAHPDNSNPPVKWDYQLWEQMCKKPYKERLIIAGALIAAEIDRIQHEKGD
jgi:hypothetical protein